MTQRQVQNRYLAMSSGATELNYPIFHDTYNANGVVHYLTAVNDPNGYAEKVWIWQYDGAQPYVGLATQYEERPQYYSSLGATHYDYHWSTSASGNPYIFAKWTTLDLAARVRTPISAKT